MGKACTASFLSANGVDGAYDVMRASRVRSDESLEEVAGVAVVDEINAMHGGDEELAGACGVRALAAEYDSQREEHPERGDKHAILEKQCYEGCDE